MAAIVADGGAFLPMFVTVFLPPALPVAAARGNHSVMAGAPSPCPTRASRHVAMLLAALAPTLTAQQSPRNPGGDPRVRIVQQALIDLADPVLGLDAERRLVHLGAFAVEPLREQLKRDRDDLPLSVRQRVLSALARIGPPALPAAREMRDALRQDDPSIAFTAAWALGRVLPFDDDDLRPRVVADLRGIDRQVRHDPRMMALGAQCSMRGDSMRGELSQFEIGDFGTSPYGVALSRWIRAEAERLERPADIASSLHVCVEDVMVREPVVWQGHRPGRFGVAEFAETWLVVSKEPLDAVIARALLDHQDPDERLRAIGWLAEHGRDLPFRERADLAGRLWDNEPMVATAAANALGTWGIAGLVALAPLRSQQQAHAHPRVQAACRAAAETIVASCAELPANDGAVMRALDAAMLDGTVPHIAVPATPACIALGAEVLFLAQWQPAALVLSVLDVADAATLHGESTIRSVCGFVMHDDPEVTGCALAWLARRGSATNRAVNVNLPHLVCSWVAEGARPAAAEAMVWLVTADADAEGLRFACNDDNLRVVARALSALLAQPVGTLLPPVERLTALASARDGTVVVRAFTGDRGTTLGDVSWPLRTLAAIALADARCPLPQDRQLDELVRKRCGVPLASLPEHVAKLREQDALTPLLDRLEAECRECIGVPAHLRWPSARAAK